MDYDYDDEGVNSPEELAGYNRQAQCGGWEPSWTPDDSDQPTAVGTDDSDG